MMLFGPQTIFISGYCTSTFLFQNGKVLFPQPRCGLMRLEHAIRHSLHDEEVSPLSVLKITSKDRFENLVWIKFERKIWVVDQL